MTAAVAGGTGATHVLKTDAYYRGVVADLLRQAGIVEAPVDLRTVADSLGIPVRGAHLPGFFSGMTVSEDGMPVFVVNSAHELMYQRSTLAHMIGHVVVVLDDETATYPRETGEHHLADVVGSELLMPEGLVVAEARKWFNDHRYLARLFGVTEGDMMDKLRGLGIIKDRGIHWDY